MSKRENALAESGKTERVELNSIRSRSGLSQGSVKMVGIQGALFALSASNAA